ncbi:tetratricopeptide repeat protein [Streptomyces sp. NBC_00029]
MHVYADRGSLAVGRADSVTYVAPPRRAVFWPHQVGVIPRRARSFQHRAEAERLQTAVVGGGTAVLCQVLTGMGGVGKTQLAADYAHTVLGRGQTDVLVWVTAGTRPAIVAGYAQAGVELCQADPTDPEQAARTFLAWLTPKVGKRPCRWLIVLDDVAEPGDLLGLWPPDSQHGRTLVTTRRRDAALTGQGRRRIDVGLFTKVEAVAYLTAALAAHGRSESADQLTALAADLGLLPLALSQAAAYLIDTDVSCAAYRRQLADRANKLARLLPEPPTLPDDQAATVAAVWSLSVERADALRPAGLARPLLQLTAMLDSNGIPRTVLISEPALAHLTTHRTPHPDGGHEPEHATADDVDLALRALYRLSLIEHTPDTPHQAVRVHQLIQRATRDTLTPEHQDRLAHTAADALSAAWPGIERDTGLAQILRANTTALTGHAQDALYRPDAHAVLYRAGQSLGDSGQVIAAHDHFRYLAATTRLHLGPDHPDTLTARGNLASYRGEAGDAVGATTAFAELLKRMVQVLGPDHPHTRTTRHNLASWRGEAGDPVGAAAAFAELLNDQLKVLGPKHPDTLITRGNLASWKGIAGDPVGAATTTAELLDDQLKVLGPDHPHTLTTRGNLASWKGEAGDPVGAAAAFAELLGDRLKVLGPDHPDTLTARGNLARWKGVAGDAASAATTTAELLERMVQVLGPDHPHTLATRGNLASWKGEAGDAHGAAAAFAELRDDQLKVLGPDHPDTLMTRHNLAAWRGEAGDPVGAAAAFAELLGDRLKVLGPDHPDTLITRGNLASWKGIAGDPVGATTAFTKLLDDQLKVLGPDHPDTLITRGNLASWKGIAGDPVGATTAFTKLLDDQLKVLGPDHPDTLTSRDSLAYWQGKVGNGDSEAQ